MPCIEHDINQGKDPDKKIAPAERHKRGAKKKQEKGIITCRECRKNEATLVKGRVD